MKIALAQMSSIDDINVNLNQIKEFVISASQKGENEKPEIIFFPENSLYFRMRANEKLPQILLSSKEIQSLEELSRKTQIALHLTSSIFDQGKNWNASFLISTLEPTKIIYKKIHLFDITLNGDTSIRESDAFTHGTEVTNFKTGDYKIGSSICYDIRFSELYHKHALQQVDAIVVPAAFLVKTGIAHWEVLLKARAIESQCYIIAPAQWGTHRSADGQNTRETFGHTMLIGPWGEVMAQKKDGVGLIYATLDKSKNLDVRKQIPMKDHRRI